jgi:hypothetical protein
MHESGFTKLFSSIVTSSIWGEDDKTRIVWITMLACSNRYGEVGAALPGLANAARVSVKDCQKAIDKLTAPDRNSRSLEFEGRRIEKIDGGWQILNYGVYRKKMRSRAEYFREYRKDRNKSATLLTPTQPIAEAEAEADNNDNQQKSINLILDELKELHPMNKNTALLLAKIVQFLKEKHPDKLEKAQQWAIIAKTKRNPVAYFIGIVKKETGWIGKKPTKIGEIIRQPAKLEPKTPLLS